MGPVLCCGSHVRVSTRQVEHARARDNGHHANSHVQPNAVALELFCDATGRCKAVCGPARENHGIEGLDGLLRAEKVRLSRCWGTTANVDATVAPLGHTMTVQPVPASALVACAAKIPGIWVMLSMLAMVVPLVS